MTETYYMLLFSSYVYVHTF